MTLEEARADIDAVDTQMKPLFLKRMECAKKVAEVKAETGGDVFVLERELSIIEKRAGDVDQEVYDEYVTFLRHLMSVSRRYQYGKLTAMQDTVVDGAAQAAGVDEECGPHTGRDLLYLSLCHKRSQSLCQYDKAEQDHHRQHESGDRGWRPEDHHDAGRQSEGEQYAPSALPDRQRGRRL